MPRPSPSFAVALLALAACHGAAPHPAAPPAPAPTPHVDDRQLAPGVTIEGNAAFDTATLRAALGSAATADDDAGAVERYYAMHGYVDGRAHATGSVVSVREGVLFHIGAVTLTEEGPFVPKTPDALSDPAIANKLVGQPFIAQAVGDVLQALRARYDAAGLSLTAINPTPTVDQDHHTVDLAIQIVRSPVVRITKIDVVGTHTTPDADIIRLSGLHVGDILHDKALDDAARRLNAPGKLHSSGIAVSADPGPDIGPAVRLTIEIDEAR